MNFHEPQDMAREANIEYVPIATAPVSTVARDHVGDYHLRIRYRPLYIRHPTNACLKQSSSPVDSLNLINLDRTQTADRHESQFAHSGG